MTYFLKLNANAQRYYPNSSHILVENNSQIVQNSAVSYTLFAALFGTSQKLIMSGVHEVFVESSVRGYHAYFKYSTVRVGDLMMCEIEEDNPHDKYAVAVKK